ncbi:uncharacterized protein [Coffea arabica]|uniref:RNase H type-1 domain-containing protein n=1 Tax=Coffea arabica TaxID=13443 RepID=A0ABM4W1B1_COFAR
MAEDTRVLGLHLVPFLQHPYKPCTMILRYISFPSPYVKLNVDKSSIGNPEAMVLLEGLHLCLDQGLTQAIVKLNSSTLLNVATGVAECMWRIFSVVSQIKALLNARSFILQHCYRELNAAADSLTKQASTSRSSSTYHAPGCPFDIRGLLSL